MFFSLVNKSDYDYMQLLKLVVHVNTPSKAYQLAHTLA